VLSNPVPPAQAYTNNEACTWIIVAAPGSAVLLTVNSLDSEAGFDVLEVLDGSSSSGPFAHVTALTGTVARGTQLVSYGGVVMLRWRSDSSIVRGGFNVGWQSTTAMPSPTPSPSPSMTPQVTCDATVTITVNSGETGRVANPLPPATTYTNNEACAWTLVASDVGAAVVATISRFASERNYDVLRVYDGGVASASALVAVLTGDVAGGMQLAARSGTMLLVWTTDDSVRRAGFELLWSSSLTPPSSSPSPAPVCASSTSQTGSGTVTNPHPRARTYTEDEACEWTLVADDGKAVVLTVARFSTEAGFDTLSVFAVDGLTALPLAELSGAVDADTTFVAYSGVMLLRWSSDESIIDDGFELAWTSASVEASPEPSPPPRCPPAMSTEVSGTLVNPEPPSVEYSNNAVCEWTLAASRGAAVVLTVLTFNSESVFDVLELFDGPRTSASARVGALTGSVAPGTVYTAYSGTMVLRGTLHPCPTPSVAVPVSLTLRSRSRCCLHARQTPGGVHPRFRASELWSADRSSTACNAGLRARRSRRRQWTRATLSHGPLTTVRHRGCTAP
jgi:hypothetical protein